MIYALMRTARNQFFMNLTDSPRRQSPKDMFKMPGQFRTFIMSLLLVLAICGAGIANAWDFSDFHNGRSLHIEKNVSHDNDMDDIKHKQLILPTNVVAPSIIPLPDLVVCILTPTVFQL